MADMTVEQALALVEAELAGIIAAKRLIPEDRRVEFDALAGNFAAAVATLRAEFKDMRDELDATIEQRDLLSENVLALERERDDLRLDAKRLDWLMDNSAMVKTDGHGSWHVEYDWLPEDGPKASTKRGAIDAAMKESHHEGQ